MGIGREPESEARGIAEELESHPGRLALLVGEPTQLETLIQLFNSVLGWNVCDVGMHYTSGDRVPTDAALREPPPGRILRDIEILFWPSLRVDPLKWARLMTKDVPRLVVWPGTVHDGRVSFSEPGRRDHFTAQLTDAIVMRPRSVRFLDEVPFEVERVN